MRAEQPRTTQPCAKQTCARPDGHDVDGKVRPKKASHDVDKDDLLPFLLSPIGGGGGHRRYLCAPEQSYLDEGQRDELVDGDATAGIIVDSAWQGTGSRSN